MIVDVDALRVTGLRCAFKITKTLTKEPNALDLSIFNLSETSRARIQETGSFVRVTAGYEGNTDLLFSGDAMRVTHMHNGTEWITRLQAGDGIKALRRARVSQSFAPGTSIIDAMKKIATDTGLKTGNLVSELARGNVRNTLTEFAKGFVASGIAGDELDKLARTMGRDLSVQDGAIHLTEKGQAVDSVVVVLGPSSGLIGSPEVAEVDASAGKKAVTKARSLIQQRLVPGRRLVLTSRAINGTFRIEKVVYTGDTDAEPWYADLELKSL